MTRSVAAELELRHKNSNQLLIKFKICYIKLVWKFQLRNKNNVAKDFMNGRFDHLLIVWIKWRSNAQFEIDLTRRKWYEIGYSHKNKNKKNNYFVTKTKEKYSLKKKKKKKP